MMDAGRHPQIEILISSEVTALEGEPGDFRAHVTCRSVGVEADLCTGCGDCAKVCPVKAPNPFDVGLSTRRAIYRPFPQSVPAVYTVDPDLCLSTPEMIRCERCIKACPTGAAQLNRIPKQLEIEVGAVVVATGFEEFDPSGLRRYGYSTYPNVLTSLELERLLNASGPTLGHVKRPSDGEAPRNLIYVQCVGARGEGDRPYCSRFCCMNAVKDAMLLKQHDPNVESVTILYVDIRAFGKGFEEFYQRAQKDDWIHFIRGRPAKITEDDENHNLLVHVEDTEKGEPVRLEADMVVLSCAGLPSAGTDQLAESLDIETNRLGFIGTPGVSPVLTSREGVFVCGSATGPQVIPDCVAQGSAAATEAAILLREKGAPKRSAAAEPPPTPAVVEMAPPEGEPDGPVWAKELPEDFDPRTRRGWARLVREDGASLGAGSYEQDESAASPTEKRPAYIDPSGPARVGVFLCHCGINIAGILDIPQLLEYAKTLPNVAHVTDELFACSSSSQSTIQEAITEHNLNRVVVAACTPRTHEPVFRQNCREAGLNPYLVEMVNIRDQCSWVHADEPEAATEKAMDLLRMATARAQHLAPLSETEVEVTPHVLVIGGGLPGMKAASDLAALGFEVTLVEQSRKLGGLLGDLHSLYPDDRSPEETIAGMVARMRKVGVDLRLGTEVQQVTGFVGNFTARLGPTRALEAGAAAKTEEFQVGALIVAIGADAYEPARGEFGRGTYKNVITSLELEAKLKEDPDFFADIESAAFIQCVGSRATRLPGEEACGNPGCSRICCPTTVKQSLELRRQDIDTICFYRDMRMVSGGAEEMYRRSREAGTVFLRFGEGRPPRVTGEDDRATAVRVYDTLLQAEVQADVDLVVLGVGLVPRGEEAKRIQEMLKTPQGADGFFLERHPELGPVETCVDGVILCGTAQGPKDLPDAIAQASAAASKAAALLGKGVLRLDPAVCRADAGRCRGCGVCVSICDFHAPTLTQDAAGRTVVEINPALCKGCGTCAVWCPTGAIKAEHFTDQQIGAMIDSLFTEEAWSEDPK